MTEIERFTPHARRALGLAHQEAERTHSGSIGTGHLLVGLIMSAEQEDGAAARILDGLGIKLDRVHRLFDNLIGKGDSQNASIKLGQDTQRSLENSIEEMRRLKNHSIGLEHVLLGLMQFQNQAVEILKQAGITPDQTREQVGRVLYDMGKIENANLIDRPVDLNYVLGGVSRRHSTASDEE